MSLPSALDVPGPVLRHRDRCRLCDGTDLTNVLSLAPTPPANAFVPRAALQEEQRRLPLDLWFCQGCTHLQLLDVVDPVELFRHYVYASATSPVFVAHFEGYARDIASRFQLEADDLVVDIGSNDGTLLSFFQARGQRALGVDPAEEIAAQASSAGIETVCAFFTPALARLLRDQFGAAKVVTANNVFAHVDDLSACLSGVRSLLSEDGVFVFEVSYLLDVYEQMLFDTIYHEHLDYHSVISLVPFFERHGMRLIDVTQVSTHGGSLRGIAVPAASDRPVLPTVSVLIAREQAAGLDHAATFQRFGARIDELGAALLTLLRQLRSDGRTVAGFGAPAKATTLMHHFGIDGDLIDFVVDDSPLKQGLYTPGFHIPVVPSQAIYDERPDYLLVLAWNFAPSIMANHRRFAEAGGRFIVPLPRLEVH